MPPKKKAFCSKCNKEHARPVGKKCDQANISSSTVVSAEKAPEASMDAIMSMLGEMSNRLAVLEARTEVSTVEEPPVDPVQTYKAQGVIPTREYLANSVDVQREVSKRLAELETTTRAELPGNTHKFKSGRFRTSESSVNNFVRWPHEMVYIGASRKRILYDELTPVQWMLGFLRCLQEQRDTATSQHMLSHGINVLQDAVDVSFPVAKGAYAVTMHEMEEGRVTWGDTERLERIRQLYTQRHLFQGTPEVASQAGKTAMQGNNRQVCAAYQNGSCSSETDHRDNGILQRHICAHCVKTVKKAHNHPQSSCFRFLKQQNRGSKAPGSNSSS